VMVSRMDFLAGVQGRSSQSNRQGQRAQANLPV
jgi:hypothetical protein